MSSINLTAQRALTEKRGKELDRWIEMKCIRFMSGIEPFSPTLSDLPTEIIHQVLEKLEPVEVIKSRELCRSIRNVVNKFAISYGGITLFLRNNTVSKHTSPTFSCMPTKIINQVVEKMEPMDRLRARKVCRSLRTAVDKFGLRFDYIGFLLRKDEVEIWWSGTEIIYNTAANGSSSSNVIHNEQTKLIDGENFVERAAKDFKILSKHAGKIKIWNFSGNRCDIVTTFIKIFKAEKCIHVKEIALTIFGFDEVLTILSWLDAKELKTIELEWMESIDRFERITQLEQWKNAEVVKIYDSKIAKVLRLTMIVHFFHFKCFTINYTDEFPAQAAIQIRDDLLRRSTFQSCEIYFDKTKTNPIEIAKVFKPDYTGGNVFKIEFSNGNDKFDISLQEFKYRFLLNMKRSLSV